MRAREEACSPRPSRGFPQAGSEGPAAGRHAAGEAIWASEFETENLFAKGVVCAKGRLQAGGQSDSVESEIPGGRDDGDEEVATLHGTGPRYFPR